MHGELSVTSIACIPLRHISSLLIVNMSHHQAEVPADGSVKQDVRAFFEQFYLLSDTPEAHQEYANQFTENGVLIMIGDRRNGRQGWS